MKISIKINKFIQLILASFCLSLVCFSVSYANDISNISDSLDYEKLILQEEAKISDLKKEHENKVKNCYAKFFINSCLDNIKEDLYKKTDAIEAKILEYKQANRQKIFDAGQIKIADANKKFELDAKNRAEQEKKNITEFENKQSKDKDRIKY
ncbi:MAG: hypothetical protein RLZZ210_211 [Pseudomonadota bacterium]|jgi:hypothetical protein